ncbi:hypothetical protein GBAR_LOCUS20288 [Geodia barretti]|uniref:Uncharacterized protein n=1 Tax=Geodia barretti TaxID=519541 RepID=A0AA35SU12_GEOBA|nr:hypothetical protein GBAR_LOCUS20288 [Geodia barretti]
MSASQSPELSDIHTGGGPSTVAETLQVSTEPATISIGTTPLSAGAVVSESHAVGASISVPPETSGGVERSSTALLNLASNSLSLTEILNAQQQALEQFQCQLQLAQQTEAINQRLDAIERTLNSLIQQKAQEDAEKKAQQEQAEQQAAVAAAHLQQQEQQQVDRLTSTPVRPSQQVPSSPSDLSELDKKRKLPRELCAKVRSTYHSLNLEFKIDERFLSPANQRVTDSLIDNVYNDTGGAYTAKDIKRATHRYYESRRRLGIEDMPERQEKAAEQRKKRKYRARQQRAYDRRRKLIRESEVRYWEHVTPACMTEESDSENGEKIVLHSLLWRSECESHDFLIIVT